MMTNVIPMAMMATTEICFITFSKLSRLRHSCRNNSWASDSKIGW